MIVTQVVPSPLTQDLDAAVHVVARGAAIGERAEFFSTPTSVFAAFGTGPEQRTFLFRVEPRDADLGRLSDLDELVEDVVQGRTSPALGIRRLASIEMSPPRYGKAPEPLAPTTTPGSDGQAILQELGYTADEAADILGEKG